MRAAMSGPPQRPYGTGLIFLGAAAALIVLRRRRAGRVARLHSAQEPTVAADDGLKLHVDCTGPSDAPVTVVLAHGFAARMQEWQEQVPDLRRRARVVRYDQRGHGGSGWRGRRSATMTQLGRDLHTVVAACSDGPVVVVGHSMGGMAVLALARQRPELFGSTIVGTGLLSTSVGDLDRAVLPGIGQRALRLALTDVLADVVWELAPVLDRLAPFGTPAGRMLVRRWLFGRRPGRWAVARMQRMFVDTSDSAAAAFLPAVISHDERAALEVLARIPTLVLTGSEDRTIPREHSVRIAGALGRRAWLVEVQGAGHMVNLTHAAKVNGAIDDLIAAATSEA